MLIIIGGLPSSGKTTMATILSKKLNIDIISPTSLYPENLHKNEELRQIFAVSAWEVCMDAVEQFTMDNDNDKKVIFDSISLNANTIRPIILNAQNKGHKVLYVLCITTKETAKKRGKRWVGDEIYAKYLDQLKKSIKSLNATSDKLIVLKNEDDSFLNIKKCYKDILDFLNAN